MRKNYASLKQYLIALISLLTVTIVIHSCKKEQGQAIETISALEARAIYENQLKKEGVKDAIASLIDWKISSKPIAIDSAVAFKLPIRTKSIRVKTYLVITKKDSAYDAFYQQEEARDDAANTDGFTGIITKRQLNGHLLSKNYYQNDLVHISLPNIKALSVNDYVKGTKRASLNGQEPADCCKEVFITVTVYNTRRYHSGFPSIDCQYSIKFDVCAKSGPTTSDVAAAIIGQTCSPEANHTTAINEASYILAQVSMDLGARCQNRWDSNNPYWLDPDASDGSDYYTPPAQQRDTTNSVTNPCINKSLLKALGQNVQSKIKGLMTNTFLANSNINLSFTSYPFSSTGPNATSDAYTTSWNSANPLSQQIAFNENLLPKKSEEYIVATVYHEVLHAYLANLFPVNSQGKILVPADHQYMATNYVTLMANDLRALYPTMSEQDAKALAWGGLEKTSLYDLKNTNEKIEIASINNQYSNKPDPTKPNIISKGNYCP